MSDKDPWAPPTGTPHSATDNPPIAPDSAAAETPPTTTSPAAVDAAPAVPPSGSPTPEFAEFAGGILPTEPIAGNWQPPNAPGSYGIPDSPGQNRKNNSGTILVLAIVAGLVAGLFGGIGGYAIANGFDSGTSVSGDPIELSGSEAPPLQEGSVAAIAQDVLPSVVSLEVTGGGQGGSGSGFILRKDGYILTNNHVIDAAVGSGTVKVFFNDGSSTTGEVIGRSKSYDLGLVKVDADNLPPVTLGNSDAIRVGDPVIAIGSPLGLNGTVTTGIVSAIARPVTAGGGQDEQSFISALQTDAAINPGNSGGPLLDAKGRVIGINSAIATVAQTVGGQAGSIGLGFAIPINQAKRVAEEIIATGEAKTPIVGVSLDTGYSGDGAKVRDVTAGGPAAEAGVEAGDIVTSVNGIPVIDSTELVVAIRANAPGDEITLGIQGKGDVKIKLGSTSDG